MRAVIFDFDGLMVDTETPAFEAWAAIFAEHHVKLALEVWVQCVGAADNPFDPVAHLQGMTGKQLDRLTLQADKDLRKASVCDTQPLMPGVLSRLDEAKALGLKLAVASSSHADWVHGHLKRLKVFDRFALTRTRGDVSRGKPFPDLYLSAAAGLGVAPADCLVFEDSLNGLRAAKAAGMRCFVVPNPVTRGSDFSAADGVLESLAAVKLEELLGL